MADPQELSVTAIKREDRLYHFDHPHHNTIEELLMNETEKAIDKHYYLHSQKYPITGDKVQISLYLNEPDYYDTLVIKETSDLGGTTYTDTALDQPIWLCPWLQGYFGFVPKKMYIKIQVINNC